MLVHEEPQAKGSQYCGMLPSRRPFADEPQQPRSASSLPPTKILRSFHYVQDDPYQELWLSGMIVDTQTNSRSPSFGDDNQKGKTTPKAKTAAAHAATVQRTDRNLTPQRHLLRHNLRQVILLQPMHLLVVLIHLRRPVHGTELRSAHRTERCFLVIVIG